MAARPRDAVDHHVARWAEYWRDNPGFVPEIEGALVRMSSILREQKRGDAVAFAGSDFTFEDYKTLENKQVTVKDFSGPFEANKVIRDSIEGYRKLRQEQQIGKQLVREYRPVHEVRTGRPPA